MDGVNPKGRRRSCPSWCRETGEKEGPISPSSTLCPTQILNELHDDHSLWGGQPTLQSPPISILSPSSNTLTDTTRSKVNLAPLSQATHKLTITWMYISLGQRCTWDPWLPSSRIYFKKKKRIYFTEPTLSLPAPGLLSALFESEI